MKHPSHKHFSAFSLVELMTAIVIIGIIAAVAVPNYRSYAIEARVAEGYVLIDAIKKGNITYHAENGVFATGYLSDNANYLADFQEVMNGGKIQSGSVDGIMADIGNVVSPDQYVNFFVHALHGGYDERSLLGYGSQDGNIKIMIGLPNTGTACTSTHYTLKANTFGVEDGTLDNTYDYFLTAAVMNGHYPGTTNCAYLVQKVDTHGDGYNSGPIVKLQ